MTRRRSLSLVRFLHLDREQRRLTLAAAGWLLYALWLRRRLPAQQLLTLAGTEDSSQPGWDLLEPDRLCAVTRRKAALQRASRTLRISNCLVKATALRLSLARAGIGSTLHLGVRKASSETLAAHAWVSVAGRILLGDDQLHQPYVELRNRALATARPPLDRNIDSQTLSS